MHCFLTNDLQPLYTHSQWCSYVVVGHLKFTACTQHSWNPEIVPDLSFSTQEPKFDSQKPKFGYQKPKFGSQKPKFDFQKPKFDSQKPKFGYQKPMFDSKKPKCDSQKPKFVYEKPKFDYEKPKFWFSVWLMSVFIYLFSEGIPPSQVPLRGRGRPSRFNMYDLSDAVTNGNGMANGLNGSQAHHQHQTQLDMEMSMELKMSPTALGVQGSPPSLHHPMSPPANMAPPTTMAPPSNMPPPASAPPYSSVSTSNEQQEHQQSSHQQEHENSEKTAGMHPQMAASNGNIAGLEMAEADDQSLSLAVEMAAVNQAIIALSGQTPVPPIHVKPEKE